MNSLPIRIWVPSNDENYSWYHTKWLPEMVQYTRTDIAELKKELSVEQALLKAAIGFREQLTKMIEVTRRET